MDDLGGGRFRDVWGITFQRIEYAYGTYLEYDSHPLADVSDWGELADYPWPSVHEVWDFSNIKCDAQAKSEYAVVYDGAILFQYCYALRGFERLLMDLAESPGFARALLEKVVDHWVEFGTALLEQADGWVDLFVINDDYGTQDGPLFRPDTWREFLKPLVRKAVKAYKEYGVKVVFHSCGSVRQFIPDFIEMGVDVLDPVQVSALGMDPAVLKREFGDALTFRGAIDTQEVLPRGTPEQVKDEVKRRILELAPGGGYIATSVHNIQPDVPLENIMAMYEALWEFGEYPIAPATA